MLTKCENKGEDMVDILQYTHRYVPKVLDEVFVLILFGGDQLTRERAYHAQDAKLQSSTLIRKLLGIIPKCEDWHARTYFYQVCNAEHCVHSVVLIDYNNYL